MTKLPFEAHEGQDNGGMPGVRVWQAIESTPEAMRILEKGKKGTKRRDALKAYLTTPTTHEQLLPITGVRHTSPASRFINRAIVRIWPLLPEDIHRDYQTPQQALHGQTGKVDNLRSLQIRDGMSRRRRQGLPVGAKTRRK